MSVITVFIKSCRECPALNYNHDKEIGFCQISKKTIYDCTKIHCNGVDIKPVVDKLLPEIKNLP